MLRVRVRVCHCQFEGDDYISSVSWMKDAASSILAVGSSTGEVQLWDATKGKRVRNMGGHSARVGAMDWNANVLSSGCRDGTVFHHDVRVREHHIGTLTGHDQEVCCVCVLCLCLYVCVFVCVWPALPCTRFRTCMQSTA